MGLTFGGKKRPGGTGPRTPLDPLEQSLTNKVAAVLRALALGVDVDALAQAISALDPDRLERLLYDVQVGRLGQVLERTMYDVYMANSQAEVDRFVRANPTPTNPWAVLEQYGIELPNGIRMPAPGNDLSFEIPDPKKRMFRYVDARATAWAQSRSAELVTAINDANRLAIRQIIGEAFTGTRTVDQTARRLRDIVGLHPRWAKAVVRNRDAIYERLIREGATPGKADEVAARMTKTYRDRLIRRRAEMISRTEIQQTQNVARQAAWDVGMEQGYVDLASMKEWRTADKKSAYGPPCDICAGLAGSRVPANGSFANGMATPPAHPHCRCTAVLVAPSRGLEGLPSQDMGSWLERLDQMYVDEGAV